MSVHRVAVFVLLVCPSAVTAQVGPDTTATAPDTEALLEGLTDDDAGDPTMLLEALADLAAHPLDVNTATAEDLLRIPAFDLALAQRIVAYRLRLGPFVSLPALQHVPGVTADVYAGARPYLTIGTELDSASNRPSRFPATPRLPTLLRDLKYEWLQRYSRRLDLGRGYDADDERTTYLGSPDKVYTRFRARAGRTLSVNITAEKDAGERFGWNAATHTYGYDFVSAHAALADYGRVRTLVVGDYVLTFGQGMVLWRSSGFGKSRAATALARYGRGVDPSGSTEENQFFRGAAATLAVTPTVHLSTFASRRTLDATLGASDTLSTDPFATNFARSGLHRTSSELAKKDVLTETLGGNAVVWTHPTGRLGAIAYHARFDRPLTPDDLPYRRFDLTGDRFTMASVFGDAVLGPAQFFGEVARAPGGTLGGVGGTTYALGRTAEATVLVRHYPRDFASLHGYAFGERNGATQNETGVYLGVQVQPAPAWRLAGYVDQFRFPWLRFGVPRPSKGFEALAFVQWQPRPWAQVYLQGRTETKDAGAAVTDATGRLLRGVQPQTRQSLRLHGDYLFSRHLRLRARAEVTRFVASPTAPPERGLLLYQDVRVTPHPALQFDLRLAVFDTDSFGARVYAFENDLLYVLSNPGFSGQGQRAYVLVRYQPFDGLTLWLKYAETRYPGVRTVGSGLDEVDGNALRDVRIQLRLQF